MTPDESNTAWMDDLFDQPDPKGLHALSSLAFHTFIHYLFQREGRFIAVLVDGTQDAGVDIELRSLDVRAPVLQEVVQVKHYVTRRVRIALMNDFIKAMQLSNVTTGRYFCLNGFVPEVHSILRAQRRLQIVLYDQDAILRWIDTIRQEEQRPPSAAGNAEQPISAPSVVAPALAAPLPDPWADTLPRAVVRGVERPPLVPTPLVGDPIPILCVANNKGGIGKTTVAGNIAGALAQENLRVLLIDADAQGNLTTWLANLHEQRAVQSLYAALVDGNPLMPLVRRTLQEYISIIPASAALDDIPRDIPIATLAQRFAEALTALAQSDAPFDYIIIDTPPHLHLLTRCAIAASRHLLLPFELEPFSFAGVRRLLTFVQDTELAFALPPVQVIGGVAVRVPSKRNANRVFRETIATQAIKHPRLKDTGLTVTNFWCGALRELEEYRNASVQHQPLIVSNPKSSGTADVLQLTAEVRSRVQKINPRG